MLKKLGNILTLNLLVLAILAASPGVASSQPLTGALDVAIIPDQPFYGLDDHLQIKVSMTNRLIEALQLNAELLILPRTPDPINPDLNQLPLDQARWRGLKVNPGGQELTFSKPVSAIFQSPGAYPVRFIAYGRGDGSIVADYLTFIVIMDKTSIEQPLDLCLILPFQGEPSLGPDGTFIDHSLFESLRSDAADSWPALFNACAAEQQVHFSVAVTPVIFDELELAGKGFSYLEGKNRVVVESDSELSQSARRAIQSVHEMARHENVGFAADLYAGTSLYFLIDQGWQLDAFEQWQRSLAIFRRYTTRQPAFAGASSVPNKAGLEFMAKQSIKTVVVGDDSFTKQTGGALQLPLKSGSVKALAANNQASVALSSGADPGSLRLFMAVLAADHIERESGSDDQSVLVVFPHLFKPNVQFINELFRDLKTASWIKTLTINEAAKMASKRPHTKLTDNSKPAELPDVAYIERLQSARLRYRQFASAVAGRNQARESMQGWLFAAEAPNRLAKGTVIPSRYAYVQAIDARFIAETQGLSLAAEPLLTLSGMSGRLPFAIKNKNKYEISVKLDYDGSDFRFDNGETEVIRVLPKENILTKRIHAREPGKKPITISMRIGDEVIDTLTVSVKTTNFNQTASIIIGMVILAGFGFIAYRRFRSGG